MPTRGAALTRRNNAFARREEGKGTTEYILLALLVAATSVLVVALFGQNSRSLFATSSNSLAGNTSAVAEKGEEACGLACAFKCFVAGTPVLLSSGERKPIEQVARGDWVLAPASLDAPRALGSFPVVGTVRRVAEALCDITLEHEGGIETLSATPEHPFAVVRGQRAEWVEAELLQPGDEVAAGASVARVLDVSRRMGPSEVFNLEVGTAHAFLVGAGGVVVHNIFCDDSNGSPTGSKKRGDHLVANGLGKSVIAKLESAAESLPPELAEAFTDAKRKLEALVAGPAFKVTVDKGPTPAGGDAQSKAFGEAIQEFRGKFDKYFEAIEDVATASRDTLADAQSGLQRAAEALNASFEKVLEHAIDSEVASQVGSAEVREAQAAMARARQILADMTKSVEERLRR
jgi:hypothetical protein